MKDKVNKDKTTMTTREVGALIEDLRSQFRIFGEDLSGVKSDLSAVKNKLDALYDEVGSQKGDIFVIKSEQVAIKSDIKKIQADLAEIKVLLKNHDSRIAHLEIVK